MKTRGNLVFAGQRDFLQRLRLTGREAVGVLEHFIARREGERGRRLVLQAERHAVPIHAVARDLVVAVVEVAQHADLVGRRVGGDEVDQISRADPSASSACSLPTR